MPKYIIRSCTTPEKFFWGFVRDSESEASALETTDNLEDAYVSTSDFLTRFAVQEMIAAGYPDAEAFELVEVEEEAEHV